MDLFPDFGKTCDDAGDPFVPVSPTGTTNLICLLLVFGYVTYMIGETTNTMAERLAKYIPRAFASSVVVPIAGAMPDVALILASGFGTSSVRPTAIHVGVGTLVGSTVFLLTVPFAAASFAANKGARLRNDIGSIPHREEESAQLLRDRFRASRESISTREFGTSQAEPRRTHLETWVKRLPPRTRKTVWVMLLSSSTYLFAQLPDWFLFGPTFEKWWLFALTLASLSALAFHMAYTIREASKPLDEEERSMQEELTSNRARSDMNIRTGMWMQPSGERIRQRMSRKIKHDNQMTKQFNERAAKHSEYACSVSALWAAALLLFSLVLIGVLADPLIVILDVVATRVKVNHFYVGYFVAPVISNIGEVLASISFAQTSSFTEGIDNLLSSVVLNNLLVTASFFVTLFIKGIDWVFVTETILAISVQFIVGLYLFLSKETNRISGIPAVHAAIIGSIFPLSLIYLYTAEQLGGLA